MHISYTIKQNTALLGINVDKKSVNTLSPAVFQDLKKRVLAANEDPNVLGLIIHSERNDFCYGVDISYIQKLSLQEINRQYKTLEKLHELFQLLNEGKPSVCILNGQCLGGGLELALATQYRIGIQNTNLNLGLPESKIGIIPGLGGTQRLPRLVGTETALSMLLKGESVGLERAEAIGLINENCKNQRMAITQAIRWIKRPNQRPTLKTAPFEQIQTFSAACALAKKQTQGCYPHIQTLLQAVYEGGLIELQNALSIETHLFLKVLNSEQSKRMLQTIFIDRNALRKQAKQHAQNYPLNHIGIIGGGFMGSAIAAHALANNIAVTLIEQPEQLQACAARVQQLQTQYPKSNAKLKVSARLKDLSKCELVIEAIDENLELKTSVLQEAEQYIPKTAILASNTSSIPINELAKSLLRPENFLGIHFFSPVAKMLLIEVIKGKKTLKRTVSLAQALSHHFKKVPICVNDTPGFYTTNVAIAYVSAALQRLNQGVSAYLIERAAIRIGMPTPPLKLMDEIGIDVIWKILQAQKVYHNNQLPKYAHILEKLHHQKRMGRKASAGFYSYEGGKRTLWKGLDQFENKALNTPIEHIENDLYTQQVKTAQRLVKTGIIDARSANIGAILGLGFCPWSGGPI